MLPSETIIASSAAAHRSSTDGQGRRIALRRMTVLDKLRLFKAAGPVLSQNGPWLGVALLACSVTAIDDVPVPMPANEQQIEALVARLGDPGIAAAADGAVRRARARARDDEARRGKLSRHPDLIDCLYLVKNGVPFDVAFSLPADERLAWVVVIGTLDGRSFDWQAHCWKDTP